MLMVDPNFWRWHPQRSLPQQSSGSRTWRTRLGLSRNQGVLLTPSCLAKKTNKNRNDMKTGKNLWIPVIVMIFHQNYVSNDNSISVRRSNSYFHWHYLQSLPHPTSSPRWISAGGIHLWQQWYRLITPKTSWPLVGNEGSWILNIPM